MDSTLTPPAPAAPDPEIEAKQRKKELKRLLEASGSRPLTAWERYRALNDATDEAYEQIDLSNREVRFALILMGGLNAFVVVASTKADLVSALRGTERVLAGLLLAVYALTAVYFLMQAIAALRPGSFRPRLHEWRKDSDDYPMGVRYFEDVVARDVVQHWRAWNEVHTAQLNAELAVQLHSVCLKAKARRAGLRRLYAGLRVMTLLVVALMVILVYAAWR